MYADTQYCVACATVTCSGDATVCVHVRKGGETESEAAEPAADDSSAGQAENTSGDDEQSALSAADMDLSSVNADAASNASEHAPDEPDSDNL
jgi:hypothetical protein